MEDSLFGTEQSLPTSLNIFQLPFIKGNSGTLTSTSIILTKDKVTVLSGMINHRKRYK
jgi:hypothetical protein